MSAQGARVLVVEDERNLAEGIQENLEAEGYVVELAADGQEGLEKILARDYDLVVLDVMMPRMDGLTVCARARAAGRDHPILFLTARGSVDDRIAGLEAGGDDYLAKPFHLKELLLRVEAILRRRGWYAQRPPQGNPLVFGGNSIDLDDLVGKAWDGVEHHLGRKEAMILKLLAEREGQVVTREDVLERVWGYELLPATRVIEGLVDDLRGRFERDPRAPRHLHTVAGVGYRFTLAPT